MYRPNHDSRARVNLAGFIALCTIVMSLVATMSSSIEASGGGTAQGWINSISASCQKAILAAGTGDQ